MYHFHHHMSVMELGHLLTRSGLTYLRGLPRYCFKHCNSIVNLKDRVYFTFYRAIRVTTSQKAYSCKASNGMVSLQMV
jgi:hypothetical protein